LCSGDASAAIADLCRAIALDPAYRDAYLNRGLAYWEVKRLPEAIADLSRAIEIDPACWSAYHHRGMIYSVQGDQDASFHDYLKARELRGETS
jgi:tetratricopeptide (TPR) repeat protein